MTIFVLCVLSVSSWPLWPSDVIYAQERDCWRVVHDLKGTGKKRLRVKNTRGKMQADERRKWDALQEYYIEVGERKQLRDPKGAARKRLRRDRAAGMRPEDLAAQLRDAPEPAD